MRFGDVIRRQIFARADGGAERIHPGVQLDPARVRFGDSELERVVSGRHAGGAGEKF